MRWLEGFVSAERPKPDAVAGLTQRPVAIL
jgi:hypothetical protein